MAKFTYGATRGFYILGDETAAWMNTTDGTTDLTDAALHDLTENGTVTKSAVATGASSFAYSGYSAANYFDIAHHTDFDYSTTDFGIMGWFKKSTSSAKEVILRRRVAADTGEMIEVYVNATGTLYYGTNAVTLSSAITVDDGLWHHVTVVRDTGVTFIYVDGVLGATIADTSNQTIATATIRIGCNQSGTDVFGGSTALWKMFPATEPTAAEIRTVYNTEKHMFKPYAFYTAVGTSYDLDIWCDTATKTKMVVRKETVTLNGTRNSIVHRSENMWDFNTGWYSRTDTSYTSLGALTEFIESTNGSEFVTVDVYDDTDTRRMIVTSARVKSERVETIDLFTATFTMVEEIE